jgi:ribonuclease D
MPERERPRKRRPRNSSVRAHEPQPVEVVVDTARISEIAEHLAKQPLVAFDTEFLREKTYFPQLGLIQIADAEDAWLIDPLAVSKEEIQPLLDVFTNPAILKIAHSAEQDQECLAREYGVVAKPLFDTSVGAALTGRGEQIGLAPLLRKMLKVDLPKGHTRTNWLKRPLLDAMAEYAAADVIYLVELGELLLADLDRRGRKKWALDLSDQFGDMSRYEPSGSGPAAKMAASSRLSPREYAILVELCTWRESRVRKSDIPRRWLAEDAALLQLARAKPTNADDLAQFRGLGQRVRDYGADLIVAAIQRGIDKPEEELVEPPQKAEPTQAEAAAAAVLKCLLNLLAQKNDVPLRYLMSTDTPLLLLRGDFTSDAALRDSGLLGAGSWEMFGPQVLSILQGDQAVRIEGGQAILFSCEGT